jgi:hypothetical protein
LPNKKIMGNKKTQAKYLIPRARVYYLPTGETLKAYPTLKGARTAATRFNQNAGRRSYGAEAI